MIFMPFMVELFTLRGNQFADYHQGLAKRSSRTFPPVASMPIGLRAGLQNGLLLVLCLGAGCRGAGFAGAETFTSGGSTTSIEQSGSGVSRSEVTRYPDGQRVITKEGRNTDISIQRGGSTGRNTNSSIPRAPDLRDRSEPAPSARPAGQSAAADRFDEPTRRDRRVWDAEDDTGPDASGSSATATATEFRDRMLERMQRR